MSRRASVSGAMLTAGLALLVSAGYAHPDARHSFRQGGTLRVNFPASDIDDVDPSIAHSDMSWHVEYSTALKLFNYPDAPAPRGSRLIPEGASAFKVSRDGQTYTFTIRRGFRFSDGTPVNAQSYAYAINRAMDKGLQSPAFEYIADPTGVNIAGAQDVRDGKAYTAWGVSVRRNKLLIHLTRPDGTFLSKISMPFFQAIPLSVPRDRKIIRVGEGSPLPSAGPYYISEREPNVSVKLERNPFYAQNVSRKYRRRPRRLSAIEIQVQKGLERSYQEVRSNQADYTYSLPWGIGGQLQEEFGLNGRFRVRLTNCIRYFALNSNNRLFHDNPQLRRAVNYVIDRTAMAELSAVGQDVMVPTDQYLPSGFPGFKDIKAYPFTPNVPKAQELARGHVPSGGPWIYYYNLTGIGPQRMELMRAALAQIGITIRPQGFRAEYPPSDKRNSPHAFAEGGWCADYPDPYDFINILLYGRGIQEENNNNIAYFNNPAYDDRMERAANLVGAARLRAYERLEHDLVTKEAPWAAWSQTAKQFFFSDNVDQRTFVYQPIYESAPYNVLALK